MFADTPGQRIVQDGVAHCACRCEKGSDQPICTQSNTGEASHPPFEGKGSAIRNISALNQVVEDDRRDCAVVTNDRSQDLRRMYSSPHGDRQKSRGTISAKGAGCGVGPFHHEAHLRGLRAASRRWSPPRDYRRGALRDAVAVAQASADIR
jgi:hypothetical protein